MSQLDTFYLKGAVKLLKHSQETLDSQAIIELVPNRDHTTIATPALRQRIDRELLEIFNKAHPEYAQPMVYDNAPAQTGNRASLPYVRTMNGKRTAEGC